MIALSATTTPTLLVAVNGARRSLIVNNQSSETMYISSTSGFTLANAPTRVPPNAQWKLPLRYTGALYAAWDAAIGQAVYQET